MFGSALFVLFWPKPTSAQFLASVTPAASSLTIRDDAVGTVRERLQDAAGQLQSIASRMRGAIQDTRSYTQAMARERGADVGAVDRSLTRVEDQLSRADAQVVTLLQLVQEFDARMSDEIALSNARTQFRRIRTTMLSARDGLRVALDELRTLNQQPTPTASGIPDRVTTTSAP